MYCGCDADAPMHPSRETQTMFNMMRLAVTDPLLWAAATFAYPAYHADLRRRGSAPVLLAAWMGVMLTAVLGWQYRNAAYLLPLVPALALLAAAWGPFRTRRDTPWMLAAPAAALLINHPAPEPPLGLACL